MSEIIKLKDSNGIVKTQIEVAPRSIFKKKSKRKLKRFFVIQIKPVSDFLFS